MDKDRLLAGLSYLSTLIFPFIFPLVVYFVTEHPRVKKHAKTAIWLQILPFLLYLIAIVIFVVGAVLNQGPSDLVVLMFVITIVVLGIVSFALTIVNIVKGILIFARDEW